MTQPLLDVQHLHTAFITSDGSFLAVNDVCFKINRGELVGLVGESGCGKSVTALSILRLVSEPGKIIKGSILYHPRHDNTDEPTVNLLQLSKEEMRRLRGHKIAMIFQEPMTSLNPVFTVGNQIEESLKLHQKMSRAERRDKMIELLQRVGIPDAPKLLKRYPHELSGGMRQRVMIAMALCGSPDLLIADEPSTALDVTIQAQVLDLLKSLQEQTGMSLLLITHDLGVIAETVTKVIVMYAGQVVEIASCQELFSNPQHPYTRALMKSIPTFEKRDRLETIPGNVPRLHQLPEGCLFQDRCPKAKEKCRQQKPELEEIREGRWAPSTEHRDPGAPEGRWARCYYPGDS